MKCALCIAALLISPSAALSVHDKAAAGSIPAVPKVQNANAEGFPILPDVVGLLADASREVQGLSRETSSLQKDLSEVEQTSRNKLEKQKAAYLQLLRKQEKDNQRLQATNAEHARQMMKLRDTARKTQAEIKKSEQTNKGSRAKLRALQERLMQAQKATEDALVASDDAKTRRQVSLVQASEASDEEAVDVPAVEDEHPQKSLSFLEVAKKHKASKVQQVKSAKSVLKVAKTKRKPSSQSVVKAAESVPEDDSASGDEEVAAVDEQSIQAEEHQIAKLAEPVETAQKAMAPDASDQAQVLEEGASSAQSMVVALSAGLKHVHEQVSRSESQLKLHFQKAYKAGKSRHAALVKQSEALEKSTHSMQLQEQKLEATLAKAMAAGKALKQKIHSISGFLGEAMAPISA